MTSQGRLISHLACLVYLLYLGKRNHTFKAHEVCHGIRCGIKSDLFVNRQALCKSRIARMQCIDVAYCDRCRRVACSVVCLCMFVGNTDTSELCKKRWCGLLPNYLDICWDIVLSKQKLAAMIMKYVHMAQQLRDEPQWLCMISGVTRHRLMHSQSSVNNVKVA